MNTYLPGIVERIDVIFPGTNYRRLAMSSDVEGLALPPSLALRGVEEIKMTCCVQSKLDEPHDAGADRRFVPARGRRAQWGEAVLRKLQRVSVRAVPKVMHP